MPHRYRTVAIAPDRACALAAGRRDRIDLGGGAGLPAAADALAGDRALVSLRRDDHQPGAARPRRQRHLAEPVAARRPRRAAALRYRCSRRARCCSRSVRGAGAGDRRRDSVQRPGAGVESAPAAVAERAVPVLAVPFFFAASCFGLAFARHGDAFRCCTAPTCSAPASARWLALALAWLPVRARRCCWRHCAGHARRCWCCARRGVVIAARAGRRRAVALMPRRALAPPVNAFKGLSKALLLPQAQVIGAALTARTAGWRWWTARACRCGMRPG